LAVAQPPDDPDLPAALDFRPALWRPSRGLLRALAELLAEVRVREARGESARPADGGKGGAA
jgi:hypothetical protein